ncbi:MAG: pilus assembly PilX family protein, partial [Wenzhouxiangellaceae bacterium]
ISLMFLIVLTLIGLSAANVGLMQERMAGNIRESNLAFQTAESTLRAVEGRIAGFLTTGGNGINNVQYWNDFQSGFGVQRNDCALAEVEDSDAFDSLPWQGSPDVTDGEYVVIELSATLVAGLPIGTACAPAEGQWNGKPIEQSRNFIILARAPSPAGTSDRIVQTIYFWPIG